MGHSFLVARMLRVGLAAALVFPGVGCASTPVRDALRAARTGDRAALAPAIAAADARGRLTLGEASDLARAVVRREIESASDVVYAVARIRDVRACAFQVDDVLEARMGVEDAAGGEAAFERAETGAFGGTAARRHATSSDDRWRAAAMWARTRDDDHDARARGLTDGSPLVRRAALHAMQEHDDPADADALFGAARLDPDPLVRSTALRALSRMRGGPPDLANRLRDLWTAADGALRTDIALAFTSRAVFESGGREALSYLLGASNEGDTVGVAGAILRARVDDASLHGAALAHLRAAMAGGGQRARVYAIAVAPLQSQRGGAGSGAETKALLEALRGASHSEDLDVRLAALGRLSDTRGGAPKGDRDSAIAALESIAAPREIPSTHASRARLLLAEAGDARVQAWLEADLKSAEADARLSAAGALAALGRATRAAPLLADPDPEVRTRAACTILLSARLR